MGRMPSFWCTVKYAYAIAPEHSTAAGLANRPSRTSPPAPNSIKPAHQAGHVPNTTLCLPNAPNNFCAPWQTKKNDTMILTTDSAGALNPLTPLVVRAAAGLRGVVLVALISAIGQSFRSRVTPVLKLHRA